MGWDRAILGPLSGSGSGLSRSVDRVGLSEFLGSVAIEVVLAAALDLCRRLYRWFF